MRASDDRWPTRRLIEAVEVVMDFRGRTPKKLGFEWGGGDIPAISARNVRMGSIDFDIENYSASDVLYNRWMTHGDMAKGDVLFTTEAPLGNVAQVPDDRRYVLSQRTILLRAKRAEFDNIFLYYVLQSPEFQRLLLDNASGSTALGIQRRRLELLEIASPPLKVQQKIAAALNDADLLISSLEGIIAKKLDVKQGMMQELLTGRTRLQGFADDWDSVRLSDVGFTYGGLIGKGKDDFGTGSALYVTFMEVMSGPCLRGNHLERVRVRKGERQNRIERGDVIFNGSSETPEEVALAAAVDFETSGGVFLNSFCFGFRLDHRDRIDPMYLAHYFRSNVGRVAVSVLAQGATRYNIAKSKLVDLAPEFPPLAEQLAIAEVLKDADAEIDALERRLESARAVKIGMMQELLTGRTRLPVKEEA